LAIIIIVFLWYHIAQNFAILSRRAFKSGSSRLPLFSQRGEGWCENIFGLRDEEHALRVRPRESEFTSAPAVAVADSLLATAASASSRAPGDARSTTPVTFLEHFKRILA
jgi:hypothetical protein